MNMSKDLAILIGGEYRGFEACWKSWDFLKTLSHDVFMSTWKTTNTVLNHITPIEKPVTRQQVINVLQHEPKFLQVHDQLLFNRRANNQIYHWHTVIVNFLRYKNDYKCALIIRPDFFIRSPSGFSDFVNTYHTRPDRLYTTGPTHVSDLPPYHVTVMDLFFISSPDKIIDNILTLPFQSEKEWSRNLPDMHSHMANHYNSRGENVLGVPMFFDFEIRRTFDQSIEKVEDQS